MLNKLNIKHVTSAPYNPSDNSIVESINNRIENILRILRNVTLEELKRNIWLRLDCSVNRNTNYYSYELHYGRSIFYNLNVDIEINLNEVKIKTKEKRIKHTKLIQKTRIPLKYKCGDKVFIKNFSNYKMTKIYRSKRNN
ncbi:hypothetical protein DMUE_1806 [Dictyocoela muelleri]|nr:hypothetical protein DMUE_1806 [Dictyocoela muelleri]